MSFLYSESCQQSFTIDLIDGCLHVCSYLQDIFGLGNIRYSIIHQFVTTWTGNMTISCVNMFVLIILDEVSMFLEIILKNSITYMFLQSQIKREKNIYTISVPNCFEYTLQCQFCKFRTV